MSKNFENKRKCLIFRAGHRGTKEMDLILGSFARKHVPGFSEEALEQFEALLQENDPDLYNWITGKEETPPEIISPVFEKLRQHKLV
ncbi:MAG: succinate dehydrogenase assembly factor 2 [Alphaproteobacteria bacterium]